MIERSLSDRQVLSRDDYCCRYCNKPSEEIHHIIYRSKHGKDEKAAQEELRNKIVLCKKCHDRVHAGTMAIAYMTVDMDYPVPIDKFKIVQFQSHISYYILNGRVCYI